MAVTKGWWCRGLCMSCARDQESPESLYIDIYYVSAPVIEIHERGFHSLLLVVVRAAVNSSSSPRVQLLYILTMARRLPIFQASVLPLISLFAHLTLAIDLNISSSSSISSAAQTIASSLFATYYNAASTAGDFTQPQPWYWWLSGSAWTTVMDYTVFTGDTTYKANILTALAENIGENNDFAPAAQASWEANDGRHYSVDLPCPVPG